jgi:TetR/AcrR family transcriptional regulator, tetracycline repressor protein
VLSQPNEPGSWSGLGWRRSAAASRGGCGWGTVLLGEVDHAASGNRSQPWRERVEALAVELRRTLLAHPGAVPLMIGGPMDGPHALALNERLLELLDHAGLNPADAAGAAYLLIVYVFGSIALEVANLNQVGPMPSAQERTADRLSAFTATATTHFPRTAAVTATMAAYTSESQYLWGLRRVLDGSSRSRLDPTRSPPTRRPDRSTPANQLPP